MFSLRKHKAMIIIAVLILAVSLMLQGCGSSGVSQEEYDTLLSEKEALVAEKEALEAEKDALTKEFSEYKNKMEPYEKMTEAEAEEARLRAQQEIDKIKAEEAAKAEAEAAAKAEAEAAAAAAKAEEEAKGYETGITYSQLARTPDEYENKKVKFYGEVIQVIEGDGEVQIRLAVNGDYDCIILGAYDSSIVTSRVLEGDNITIYGVSMGLITYESTMGGNITIPAVLIEKIEQ